LANSRRLCINAHGLFLCLIPKNANSAMREAVITSLGHEPAHKHECLNLSTPKECPEGATTAALIRNPYDRVASLYADKIARRKRGGTAGLEGLGYQVGMSFVDFCRKLPYLAWSDHHTRPQVSFLTPRVDVAGRFEAIGDWWQRLRALFSWLLPLPHLNASPRKPWQDYYNAETRGIVERVYAKDFELWQSI
jgi:hypothetical protein